MKPKPLVIDEVLAKPITWMSRERREELILASKRADRFVFSNAASGLIGRFARECGDLVLSNRQFAIPPFDTMCIELGEPYLATFNTPGAPGTDTDLGYLIDGSHVYIFVRGKEPSTPVLIPFYYTIVPPGETAPIDPISRGHSIVSRGEASGWNMLGFAYGSTRMKINGEDERQSLIHQVQPHLFADYSYRLQKHRGLQATIEAAQSMLANSAGEIRNVWAALLWLNRPAHATISNQPAGRRFISSKQVAYKAFHTVEIDLHKMRSIRRAFKLSGERLSPRRHKVRGAFHHMYGTIHCSHEWPLLPDEHEHWVCEKCGRIRFWVKDYVRGDATKGWVDHAYSVTTGEPVTTEMAST